MCVLPYWIFEKSRLIQSHFYYWWQWQKRLHSCCKPLLNDTFFFCIVIFFLFICTPKICFYCNLFSNIFRLDTSPVDFFLDALHKVQYFNFYSLVNNWKMVFFCLVITCITSFDTSNIEISTKIHGFTVCLRDEKVSPLH